MLKHDLHTTLVQFFPFFNITRWNVDSASVWRGKRNLLVARVTGDCQFVAELLRRTWSAGIWNIVLWGCDDVLLFNSYFPCGILFVMWLSNIRQRKNGNSQRVHGTLLFLLFVRILSVTITLLSASICVYIPENCHRPHPFPEWNTGAGADQPVDLDEGLLGLPALPQGLSWGTEQIQ